MKDLGRTAFEAYDQPGCKWAFQSAAERERWAAVERACVLHARELRASDWNDGYAAAARDAATSYCSASKNPHRSEVDICGTCDGAGCPVCTEQPS